MNIRTATTLDDCTAITELVRAHISYEKSSTVVPDDWAERIIRLIRSNRLVLLIAFVEGHAAGFASMTTDVATWTGTTFAHLDTLFVSDEHRGEGLGRVLIDAVAAQAHSAGINELQWQTPVWNEAAIRFYERTGASHSTKERFILDLERSAE